MSKTRILLDTGVWISFFGRTDPKLTKRTELAREVIRHCQSKGYQLFYCPQVELELSRGTNGADNIAQMKIIAEAVDGHTGNETWDQIDAVTWDTWGTKWGDTEEHELGETLEAQLPDKSKKSNKNDRSIVVTAKHENIKIILHENPKDFDKLDVDEVSLIDLTSIQNIDELDQLISKD